MFPLVPSYRCRARRAPTPPPMTDRPATVRLWTDPSCPWAWQALKWLRDLRDREIIRLTYSLFSLEVNSSGIDLPFDEAAPTTDTCSRRLSSRAAKGAIKPSRPSS